MVCLVECRYADRQQGADAEARREHTALHDG
jgi:hypothetical protein